jgi:hypothetical protein
MVRAAGSGWQNAVITGVIVALILRVAAADKITRIAFVARHNKRPIERCHAQAERPRCSVERSRSNPEGERSAAHRITRQSPRERSMRVAAAPSGWIPMSFRRGRDLPTRQR